MSEPRQVSPETFPVRIAPSALLKLREALEDGTHIRVGLLGGGPDGFTYHLSVGDQADDDDQRAVFDGVPVVIDTFSANYMRGTEITWREEDGQGGFVFTPPPPQEKG